MIHLNDSVYVCKEVFDENSEPTKTGNILYTCIVICIYACMYKYI